MSVKFEVNGKSVEVEVEPRMTLADCLRHKLRLICCAADPFERLRSLHRAWQPVPLQFVSSTKNFNG